MCKGIYVHYFSKFLILYQKDGMDRLYVGKNDIIFEIVTLLNDKYIWDGLNRMY